MVAGAGPPGPPVNPAPPEVALAVFLVREVLAVAFVALWLLLFTGELVSGRYVLPLWFHCISTAVLGFALGLNAAELIYRPGPSAAATVAHAVLEHRRAPEDDDARTRETPPG
jgi:uncharacterized membrane protein YhdT